jgi:hypothetical protein
MAIVAFGKNINDPVRLGENARVTKRRQPTLRPRRVTQQNLRDGISKRRNVEGLMRQGSARGPVKKIARHWSYCHDQGVLHTGDGEEEIVTSGQSRR